MSSSLATERRVDPTSSYSLSSSLSNDDASVSADDSVSYVSSLESSTAAISTGITFFDRVLRVLLVTALFRLPTCNAIEKYKDVLSHLQTECGLLQNAIY